MIFYIDIYVVLLWTVSCVGACSPLFSFPVWSSFVFSPDGREAEENFMGLNLCQANLALIHMEPKRPHNF
jgi:hypothetical protein